MMLEFLKAAADVGRNEVSETLVESDLSFSLAYAQRPDLAAERARLEALLEGDGFSLFPLSEDDPEILVLVFYGVQNDHAPDFLFEVAHTLREELGLTVVEPETGPQYADLNTPKAQTESAGAIVDSFCRSDADAHDDGMWPLKMMKVDLAMAEHGVTGAGIRVGQPDTGVARHDELDGAVNMELGSNFVDGGDDPTDPLLASMAGPGHGTGAASVLASRRGLKITGTAPGAELVPIRVSNGPVLGLGLGLARGIDHARRQGCHVISISLGTVTPGLAVRRAISRAVKADIIVIAAAGNCVRLVVYPGWDKDVITLAGVDRDGERWIGSCRGHAVDVAAPAENVHRAHREPGIDGADALRAIEKTAQGTTFAAALTAGVAALWLERHGLNSVRAAALAAGVPVQEIFREALHESAAVPSDWDTDSMGSGIVDAQALLNLPLDRLPMSVALELDGPAADLFGESFEGPGLQQEADFIAVQHQLQDGNPSALIAESALGVRPSPQLSRALAGKEHLVETGLALPFIAPNKRNALSTSVSSSLARLAVAQSSTLESSAGIDAQTAVTTLQRAGSNALLERAEEAFGTLRGQTNPAAQTEALKRMRPVIDELLSDPDPAILSTPEANGVLEALVRLTGRPVIRLHVDGSEIEDPSLGVWKEHIVPTRADWMQTTDAIGRIDAEVSPGKFVPVGTGMLMPNNHVLTNRHVIDAFAERLPTRDGSQQFRLRFPISIIFDPAAKDAATRFALPEVLSAGQHRIGRRMNLAKLDAAVLKMTPDNGFQEPPFPAPNATTTVANEDLKRIMVSGYPMKPKSKHGGPSAAADPELHDQFWGRIDELFGDEYGVQYLSPGLVDLRTGTVPFDPHGWTFTHDATTLGGNSGSAILSLHGQMPICGLHFGGQSLEANYAHDIEVIRALGDGEFQTSLLPE